MYSKCNEAFYLKLSQPILAKPKITNRTIFFRFLIYFVVITVHIFNTNNAVMQFLSEFLLF